MRMGVKYSVFLIAGFVFFSFLSSPFAEEGERVLVTVLVASNEGSDFNLDNDAYRDQLINLFSYSSYEQQDQIATYLERAKREKIGLPEGYELLLSYQRRRNGKVMIQVVIRKGSITYMDTVLSVLKPGVVFVGGPPVGEGVLILVLETGI